MNVYLKKNGEKTSYLGFRVTADEKQVIDAAAHAAREDVSEYVRKAIQMRMQSEPTQKHDGKLGKDSKVHINQSGIVVIEEYSEVTYLYPTEALSLLVWLKQEEAELQRLAKEQA